VGSEAVLIVLLLCAMPGKRKFTMCVKTHSIPAKRSSARKDYVSHVRRGESRGYVDARALLTPAELMRLPRPQTTDDADDTEFSDNELGESSTASEYHTRKQDEAIVWGEIRESLVAAALLRDAPTTYRCCLCDVELHSPIRCTDCSATFVCCEPCEDQHHRGLLHMPEIWTVSHSY